MLVYLFHEFNDGFFGDINHALVGSLFNRPFISLDLKDVRLFLFIVRVTYLTVV
jgi:hypothetical protein